MIIAGRPAGRPGHRDRGGRLHRAHRAGFWFGRPDPQKLTAALAGDATVTADDDCDDGDDLYVNGMDATRSARPPCRAGVVMHQLVTERPDLEDVFLELTKGKATIR